MTTAAEQYRALVQRLESIQEAPEDPRSPEERDSQMAAVKGAYQDYQDAEAKSAQPAASTPPAPQPSPVSGDVKKIQTLLNAKGANLTVDGKLGANTLAAIVKHLESEQGQAAQQPNPGKDPQWSIDGKPVTNTQGPSTPVGAVSNQPQDPFAKGGLFNR